MGAVKPGPDPRDLTTGTYVVTATAGGTPTPVRFSLTNVASLVVNSTSDAAYTAPGVTTLRLAITYANTFTSGTPSITFDPTASFRKAAETIQIELSGFPTSSNTGSCRSRFSARARRY